MDYFIIVAMVFLILFFIYKNRSARKAEEKKYEDAISQNNRVMLNSGLYGVVSSDDDSLGDDEVWVVLESEPVLTVKVNRRAILTVFPDKAVVDSEHDASAESEA